MTPFELFKKPVTRKSYSEQNALSFALACQLAYQPKEKVLEVVTTWGFECLDVISRRKGRDIDTQCYLMEDDKNIVVCFRGSDSKFDWLANVQTTQDPGPLNNTKAHEGFQDALFPVVIALTKQINREGQNKRVWITGHSLGGALCSLFAGMLIENGIEVYGIYTFASPRPGSAKFEKQLNAAVKGPHYRVVNDGDLVPHVPPEPFFSHPGKRIILKNTRKERSEGSWLKQRISALKNFIKMTGHKFDVADNHRLNADKESYIPKLIRDLKRAQR